MKYKHPKFSFARMVRQLKRLSRASGVHGAESGEATQAAPVQTCTQQSKKNGMKITRHALTRYHERFGQQDVKEIIRRAQNARLIKEEDGGRELKVWGAICFVIVENTILTVMKQEDRG